MTELAAKSKKKSEITINKSFCTGCGICADMCPANVLEMANESTKVAGVIASVKDIDACTQCMLCEIHCPHFAITVKKID